MDTRLKGVLWCTIALLWMGIIFNFSSMNTNESNGKSIKTIDTIIEKTISLTNKANITDIDSHAFASKLSQTLNRPLRKVAHASIYFILGILLIVFMKFFHVKKYYLYSLIISFIYACTDEFHQKFVAGRTSSFTDVLIDTLGCVIGLLIFYLVEKLIIRRRAKKEVLV